MRTDAQSRPGWYRLVATALLALVLMLARLPVASAGEPTVVPPLRSASEYSYPPFCIVTPDGDAGGFSVELLRAAVRAMGRQVTFRVGPWHEVKSWLEQGQVEVLPLVGRTPEREALFDFTFPYLTMHGAIVVRADTRDIQDLDDLRGRGVTIVLSTHDLNQAAERFDRVMLLNRRLLGFGSPAEVFTPERLMAAYGGHLHLVAVEGGLVAVGDTCCEQDQRYG